METEALSNFDETEEGEIVNDDPDELYTPLERPHISSANATKSTSLPSAESDDESALKESSSDSDSSVKKMNSSKIRKKMSSSSSVHSAPIRKKKYNIWCSDVQTEVLTNSLVDCNVGHERDRDIESYNYKLGMSHNENKLKHGFLEVESKNKKQYSTKRRHNGAFVDEKMEEKDKNVGKPKKSVQSSVRNILGLSTNLENSIEEIASDIANKLYEEKEDLILRALKILGKEFTISLFEETKKIEASGGMHVMNGTRRRTPGGVFFYLLKTSDSIPRETINLVLSEDKKIRAKEKKLSAKKLRQLKAEEFKKSLSKDDFPTLLSRTELAIKEYKTRKFEEDSAEVKNPCPSPATDGKECSSDGEEPENNCVRKHTEERFLTTYNDSFLDHEEDVMDVF